MPTDLDLIDFEARWPQHSGAKETQIHQTLRLTVPRYYQRLHRIIATPEALAHDAMTVHRVRRILERTEQRGARRQSLR